MLTVCFQFNVDISPPIMSRFDLFFIVLDECDEAIDWHVARHIVDMHQRGERPTTAEFSVEEMQSYIRFARAIRPQLTPDASKLLVSSYRDLRMRDASDDKAYRITVRQLESLIRLSEAMARLHLDPSVLSHREYCSVCSCFIQITPRYVREAARLLSKSIISVEHDEIDLSEFDAPVEEEKSAEPEGEAMDTDEPEGDGLC